MEVQYAHVEAAVDYGKGISCIVMLTIGKETRESWRQR